MVVKTGGSFNFFDMNQPLYNTGSLVEVNVDLSNFPHPTEDHYAFSHFNARGIIVDHFGVGNKNGVVEYAYYVFIDGKRVDFFEQDLQELPAINKLLYIAGHRNEI